MDNNYKALYDIELKTACAKFAKALNAVNNRNSASWDIAKKGKTLSIVNRRDCKARLTVNY